MKTTILALMICALVHLPALAGTNYNVCFSTLDADGDGSMAKSEFMIAFPHGDMAQFEAADSDRDGQVSHEEWEAFKADKGFEEGDHHG